MQGTAFDADGSSWPVAKPIVVAGRVARLRSPSRRRRRRSHTLLAVAVVVAIVIGVGGAAVGYATLKPRADELQARLTADLLAGQRELEAGKASLTQANSKHDGSLVADAIAHFVSAKGQFVAASQLADNSRLLRYLEDVPGIGSQAQSRHAAVDGIAAMGAAISVAGEDLSDLYGQVMKPTVAGQPARNLLTALDQAQPSVVKIRADLQLAQKGASQVDVAVIPTGQQATFLKARDAIASALAGLDEFDRLVPVLHDVLGGNGTRTYLIEQVNPAELRAGGGFIGTYSLIRADNGTLTLIRSGDAYDLANPRPLPGQPGFIPQPDPYREVIPDISWSFVDSNIFPDFPSSARAAMGFAQPRLGISVDGVVSVDYYTVAKMLDLTGPLTLPDFGVTVDGSNFIPELIKRQADHTHKALLSAIAQPLMERISTLPAERWPPLIGALNDLAIQRHLQAFFNNSAAEQEMQRLGWSGELNPVRSPDYMMEVESNYGGTKANYYLERHYTVVLSARDGVLHHQVVIDLINRTPSGSYPVVYYRPYVRLYVAQPVSSASDNLLLVRYQGPDPPAGTRLLDGWLQDIPCCGGQARVVFEYDTPWSASEPGLDRIYWQKQPGTVNDNIDVTWNDGNGHTYKVRGGLGQDVIIRLSPTGVTLTAGQPAQANLPSLGLG